MNSKDLKDKFKNLKVQEDQDINILLLGESGVGKSTFINAIANYLHFKTFKKAEKQDLLVLIPASFHVFDESYEERVISVGASNDNEFQEVGAAATQDVKTYVFPIGEGKTRLRLIDSPGVGDPRGVKQDDINCENILAYLGQLKELHAICFLMKPTNARITVLFEYCLKEILSRLEKSASNNLIFIFTNTRGTGYGPGDTLPCLKKLIEDIKGRPPHVDIPLKNNIFCFDNESFRFLAAVKQNVKFPESVRQNFADSWNKASEECWRLIAYIIGDKSNDGLKPHQMHNTMSINEARRLVCRLSQPLADISQLIIDNLHVLNRHRANLKMQNQSLDELKKNLYMPVINLDVLKLTQPVTVCASSKCAKIYNVGTVKKWHYEQRCHDPCHLTNITKDLIGDPGLINCAAMNGSPKCTKCSCDFSVHMHVYYMTKTVDDTIIDETVNKNIDNKKKALLEVEKLIRDIDVKSKELEEERDIIIRSAAQFAHFLQSNAITPFNDSYKVYIEHLIIREKCLGGAADQATIDGLEYMLKQYEESKRTFEKSLKGWFKQFGTLTKPVEVDAPLVIKSIHELYHLKHNGKKIKELITTQKTSRDKEYESNCVEYIHSKVTTAPSSDKNKKDQSKNDQSKKKNKEDNKTSEKNKHKEDTKGNEKQTAKKPTTTTDNKKKFVQNAKQNTGYQNRPFHHNAGTFQRTNSSPNYPNTPPPPYSSVSQPANFRGSNEKPRYENSNNDSQQNIVVKVEVTKDHRKKESGNRSDDSSHRGYSEHGSQAPYGHPNSHPYAGPSQGYGPPPPPPPHYDPGHYAGRPSDQYNPPPYHGSSGPYYSPPGPYYGPPSGPYQGPPPGPYQSHPPAPYYGPPSGPRHGPPEPYHHPPSGPHHGPPTGPYYGPPSGQHAGPYSHPRGNYNTRPSRPFNKFSTTNQGRGKYQGRSKSGPGHQRSKSNQRNEKGTTKKKHESSSSDDSSSD